MPTYRLVGTKFWGKYIQKDELKAKFGQNSSVVGTKFKSWHQVEKRSPAPVYKIGIFSDETPDTFKVLDCFSFLLNPSRLRYIARKI